MRRGRGPWRAPLEIRIAAKALRARTTESEQLLWNGLRGWSLGRWRRQHPMDRFILDFYCARAKLCVEVDGGYHADAGQRARDAERTAHLHAHGIRVLRFTDEQVLKELRWVLRCIKDEMSAPSRLDPDRRRP